MKTREYKFLPQEEKDKINKARRERYASSPDFSGAVKRRANEYYWKNRESEIQKKREARKKFTEEDKIARNRRSREIYALLPYERLRISSVMKRFGGTIEDYEAAIDKQNGRCLICNDLPTASGHRSKRLHIDHNHITGKFRGLLCSRCNVAVGFFRDNTELLKKATVYLETR